MKAIDTNLFVYANDDTVPVKRAKSIELIATITDGVLLWQVACEFLSVSRKKLKAGTDPTLIWRRLDDIQSAFPLLTPSPNVLIRARELSATHQLQLWDALIYAACLDAGISRLYSEDVPGSVIPGLEIVNPFL